MGEGESPLPFGLLGEEDGRAAKKSEQPQGAVKEREGGSGKREAKTHNSAPASLFPLPASRFPLPAFTECWTQAEFQHWQALALEGVRRFQMPRPAAARSNHCPADALGPRHSRQHRSD